ncbi:MAG: hypothetical protein AB7Q45_05875 [Planctomycetaceae bacterium]
MAELSTRCERLKAEIESALSIGEVRPWNPLCDVIVHASLREYQRALGADVGDSVGCATMQYDQGRVVSRRIDLRLDGDDWQVDALPHELTHVVVADWLGNRRIPPWLDEGLGVLSESNTKRQFRAAAYTAALRRSAVYSVPDLVHLRSFPQPDDRDAFYVQIAGLVRLLIDRSGPDEFERFAHTVLSADVDRALRQTYHIRGLDELERMVQGTDTARLVPLGGMLQESTALVADADE